jgi:hypothetical protein
MTDLSLPALREAEPTPNVCHWTDDTDPDFNVWRTGCGEMFTFLEDGPTENKMRYCCYCGLALVAVPRPPDVLEDDDD